MHQVIFRFDDVLRNSQARCNIAGDVFFGQYNLNSILAMHQVTHCTMLDELAVMQNTNRITQRLYFCKIVRADKYGFSLPAQFSNNLTYLPLAIRIKPIRRLIQYKQHRIGQQRLCDTQALQHAFGIGGETLISRSTQVNLLQHRLDTLAIRSTPEAGELGHVGEIATSGKTQLDIRALVKIADPRMRTPHFCLTKHMELSPGWEDKSHQQAYQRRFARSILTHQAETHPRFNRQRQIIKRDNTRPVYFRQSFTGHYRC